MRSPRTDDFYDHGRLQSAGSENRPSSAKRGFARGLVPLGQPEADEWGYCRYVSMGEELTTDSAVGYLWDGRTTPMTTTEPMPTTIRIAVLPIEGGTGAWDG